MNNNEKIDVNLIKIINDYYNDKISLFDFETKLIEFPFNNVSEETEYLIAEIQEYVGYTTKGKLTEEDKQDGLMTENDLKNKLHKYLLDIN